MDFIRQPAAISTVVESRRSSTTLPKTETAPKEDHDDGVEVVSRSDHYNFLNPGKTITAEKYCQEIDKIQYRKLQRLALINRKGPIFLRQCHTSYNQRCRN